MINPEVTEKWYSIHFVTQSIFFQNEKIFVQLDELYEFDRITQA